MKPTLNEKFLAYLALFSGLFLSLVAEYYSILGLTAIFAAAVIPVVIMGIALGLGKITATLWLKQNWKIAPWTMRGYLFTAIIVLMMVTSMGIFGFLSKAHSDQSLVSGDVTAKIAVYDEKIKTAQDNIDVNRKALKQLDEAVDQVMGRSTSETGADKAVAIRKSQAKERTRLLAEITAEQKTITGLREERAPIAAEVRKVEAEVGPIKYIAAFIYGETNEGILEKAVTWVIITLIVVFDPMAVILLLASQISFQNFREREQEDTPDPYIADVGEKPNEEELVESNRDPFPYAFTDVPVYDSYDDLFPPKTEKAEGDSPIRTDDDVVALAPTVTESEPSDPELDPCYKCGTPLMIMPGIGPFCPNKECDVFDGPLAEEEPTQFVVTNSNPSDNVPVVEETSLFVQNEEQKESNLWSTTIKDVEIESVSREEYLEYSSKVQTDVSQREFTTVVAQYVQQVRSGAITLDDVPHDIVEIVKHRI